MGMVDWNKLNKKLQISEYIDKNKYKILVKNYGLETTLKFLKDKGANSEDIMNLLDAYHPELEKKQYVEIIYNTYGKEGIEKLKERRIVNDNKLFQYLCEITEDPKIAGKLVDDIFSKEKIKDLIDTYKKTNKKY